ncbi:MAG: NUDIX hydrolase [Parvibaculum sp.]
MTVQAPLARGIRPRDAASLVLIDSSDDGEPLILMGRRHARMKFIPDAFVFPGGKLDAGDLLAKPATPFSGDTAKRMERAAPTRAKTARVKAQALAMAAIRETFEETGLILAGPGHVGEDAGAGWQPFLERGLAPRLDLLEIIARAITPASSPIRFHARFFAADAAAATGELKGSGELEDLGWYPLSEALKLPVIDVTEFVLNEIARRHAGATRPRIPLYCYRNDRPVIRS